MMLGVKLFIDPFRGRLKAACRGVMSWSLHVCVRLKGLLGKQTTLRWPRLLTLYLL